MNNLKIFSIIFMILQVFIIKNINAQDVLDKIPPSPDIAALGKFIDVPVSYYTGIPEITIPIHTLTEGSLSLPISLDYHAGGIKVNEVASRVGLGWALNAGGFVARTVQGLPDESPNGFFNKGTTLDLSCGDADIDAIAKGELDGEPDIFSFMIPGYSGKFYFNAAGEVVQIVHSDLKIEKTSALKTFKITTPQGSIYQFNQSEYITSQNSASRFVQSEDVLKKYSYNTAWFLTKIESYNKKEDIILSYESEYFAFSTKGNWNCLGNGFTSFQKIYLSRKIKTIKTAYETITFNYQDKWRDDLGNIMSYETFPSAPIDFWRTEFTPKHLASIEIQNGSFCKEFKLSHNYFDNGGTRTDDKRLRLDGLQEISCNGNDVIPPYTFEYFNDKPLPNRLSTAMDHWGFYNGNNKTNTGTIIPGQPSLSYLMGSTNFLPLVALPVSPNELQNIFLGLNLCDTSPIFQDDLPEFITLILNQLPSVDNGLTPGSSTPPTLNTSFTYTPTFSTSDQRASAFNFMKLGTLQKITYPYGGKHEFEYEANEYSGTDGNSTVGGLRIKKITLSPETIANNAVVKTYNYTADDETTSSGVLYHMPVYDVVWGEIFEIPKPSCSGNGYKSLDNELVIPLRMRVAENITQLSDYEGIHIGYGRVTETINDETRVLEFATEQISGDTPYNKGDSFSDFDSFTGGEIPFPPAPAQARVNAGTLLKESIANVGGTIVSEIEYTIKEDEYVESTETFAKVFEVKKAEISIINLLEKIKLEPIAKILPGNLDTIKLSNHLVNAYKIRSKPHRISSRSATLDGVTQLTKYTYGNQYFIDNLTTIEKGIDTDNNGIFDNTAEVLKTEFKYIWEIQPLLGFGILGSHMMGIIGETKTTINNSLVSGNRTEYKYDVTKKHYLPEKIWAVQGNNFVLQRMNTDWNVRGYPEKYKRAKSGATNASLDTVELAYDQNYFKINYDTQGFLPTTYW